MVVFGHLPKQKGRAGNPGHETGSRRCANEESAGAAEGKQTGAVAKGGLKTLNKAILRSGQGAIPGLFFWFT